MIRNDGTLADHQKVDSFGNIITRTNPSLYQPYAFIGRPFDGAINLYYLRARFTIRTLAGLSAAIRWVSPRVTTTRSATPSMIR